MSRAKRLWITILDGEPPLKGLRLPAYVKPLAALSEKNFEALAVQIIRLRRSLSIQQPSPTLTMLNDNKSVTWVHFICYRYFAVAASNQNSSTLSLWDMTPFLSKETDKPSLISQVYVEGPVVTGVVDTHNGQIRLALELCPNSYVNRLLPCFLCSLII